MIKKILHELRYIKWKDIYQIVLFIISIPLSLIYKIIVSISGKEIWLICEDENEARDNGYCFFKYLNENQKPIVSYYAINYKSKDYEKVKKIGKTVKYGSLKHWILYFNCKYNISTQKAGKPNAAICYVLEVYNIIKSKFIFLQHGITINKAEWLFYKNTKMRLFICGAKPEYDYVKKYFGYPNENVKYLGFCRFDNLYNLNINKKQILIMPSWREWLTRKTDAYYQFNYDGIFEHSDYYKYWNNFINSKELLDFIEKNNLKVIFYPHRNMQNFLASFKVNSKNIKIASWKEYDIQELLKESAIMITDYSSVSLDFAYMYKPIIYYQFDIEQFRKGQYASGYFDYKNSGFGDFATDYKKVINFLEDSYKNNFEIDKKNKEQIDKFFSIHDNKNCERIYKEIKNISVRRNIK